MTDQPVLAPSAPKGTSPDLKRGQKGGGGGDEGSPGIDPIIRGLLVRLPKSGEVWPEADRKLWLQLLEGSFKLIYKDKDAADQPGRTGHEPFPARVPGVDQL